MISYSKAVNEHDLNHVYRLRYKVYCTERHFESALDYPHELEQDALDPYSIHFIARIGTVPLGTVRLILRNPLGFPVENHCGVRISNQQTVVEISRLAVSKETCQRAAVPQKAVVLGLFRELYRESRRIDVEFCYAAMSLSLYRLLDRCHIRFNQIGKPVEYHGIRAPFMAGINEMVSVMYASNQSLYSFFTQ